MSAGPELICPLCAHEGGLLLLRQHKLRIVRVAGAQDALPADVQTLVQPEALAEPFPAYYRVIWNAHVAEWSDLSEAEQGLCMRAVNAVERVLRLQLQPSKINLAALGNVVPHLHWHVLARFEWDSHYPAPVWAAAQRPLQAERLHALRQRLPACDAAIAALRL
ncbi:diadenosine tetraphosphate Ap4A hydrolase and other HIT family hydrolase [Serpentinimonas raichei]|uniref:Diadenosine tetraphosphate Ap4A hydrolase and other HIT family hydrolase n=1 Tax=Serpentinimonas raichei TaxID=1458425 RepID=A0A060NFR3_9BURK|nr:HIT family protein [Serpentinimonas raichei]BAO80321.1 diadenosine tetraphosphate Ap4A hydrolase and other HIT family hydrolase [Serpentinimonas raichei]